MNNDRPWLIQGLAVLFALGSWWFLQLSPSAPEGEAIIEKHSSDYFSSGYLKQEMDDSGVLKTQIKAEKMVHYSDDGNVHLERPEIKFFQKNTPPWVIKAERGIFSRANQDLWLKGKVVVNRAGVGEGRAMTIKTSEVRVDPEKSYAETQQAAELSSPPDVTSGIGMQLNYADPIRIKLLNNVRGRYENH